MSQCPLLDELDAIGTLNAKSVILIDDARLFLGPPLAPHEISAWPSFDQVSVRLRSLSSTHKLMVINDVIMFFPPEAEGDIVAYGQANGTDWLQVHHFYKTHQTLHDDLLMKENVINEQTAAVERLSSELVTVRSVLERVKLVNQQLRSELKNKALVAGNISDTIDRLKELDERRDTAFYRIIADREDLIAKNDRSRLTSLGILAKGLPRLRKVARVSVSPIRRVMHRTKLILQPRLGNLNQYAPRPMQTETTWPRLSNPEQCPKISVVTPSYQQADYIGRTIRSVTDQGYPNLELFVQDGGSKDHTVQVLEENDHLLTGWVSERDTGQSQAINRGFSRTTGDIMAWLNSDDLLLPGSLNTVAEFFSKHQEIDVVYGNRLLIDEQDREIGRWIMPGHDGDVLSWVDYVPQETMFWRRSAWEKAGGQIDESFRFAMDWDLIIRFRESGARFVHIPRFLGAFRIHEHQKTSAAINNIGFAEMNRIRERVLGYVPDSAEIRKNIAKFMAKHILLDLKLRIKRRLFGFIK
ncbi:glycosyltransferase [Rhizobium sp. CFBP 8762]|nr:glycosyltransferase [Rhizobium sp. CFBP 8762]